MNHKNYNYRRTVYGRNLCYMLSDIRNFGTLFNYGNYYVHQRWKHEKISLKISWMFCSGFFAKLIPSRQQIDLILVSKLMAS